MSRGRNMKVDSVKHRAFSRGQQDVAYVSYLRVSAMSTDPSEALAFQDRVTKALGERLGWRFLKSYSDIAHTADDRPGLRALLTGSAELACPFQAVIVCDKDRLQRDPRAFERLEKSLARRGVQVRVLSESLGEICLRSRISAAKAAARTQQSSEG